MAKRKEWVLFDMNAPEGVSPRMGVSTSLEWAEARIKRLGKFVYQVYPDLRVVAFSRFPPSHKVAGR